MIPNSLSIRRWGVAVLSGVTLLGAVSVVGAGVASAATAAVSAPVTAVAVGTNIALPTVTITEGTAIPAASYICIAYTAAGANPAPVIASPTTGTHEYPTVTDTGTGGTVTSSNPPVVTGGLISVALVSTANTTPGTYTVAGLFANTTGASGQITATVSLSAAAACTGLTTYAAGVIAGVETQAAAVYGQTADATTAAELELQFGACTTGATSQNAVVLATDAAKSTDPMAAATLEKALSVGHGYTSVGLLITSPTSLDPNMLQALSAEGVTSVYVVGGPLAISAADLTALRATPATGCNSIARTVPLNLNVFGPFYGTTADDTALAIDTEANSVTALPVSTFSLSSVASTTYNDTTQVGSSAGAAAGTKTGILVADNDVADPAALAGVAYDYELPIIVTPGQSANLGGQAQQAITDFSITQLIVVGGQLSILPAIITNLTAQGIKVVVIAGIDYTDTSAQIAKFEVGAANLGLQWAPSAVYLTQGAIVNDALGAGVLSGASFSPILLTLNPTTALTTPVITELGALGATVSTVKPLGGPLALTGAQVTAAQTALA